MNHLVTEPWCDNCYPVNATLIFAVKPVIANFMLLIWCSLWSEMHFCQFFLIPWFVADQHVQQNTWGLEGIQQQCKCWDWFWVFLWRYRCWAWSCWGGFREASYSIQSDATVGRDGGSASAVYPSLTNSGAFVSGKVSQILWCLRIARNGIWILGIPGAACLRRLCHFSDVFVGSRNRLLWLVYQMISLWVLSGAGRNYNP